MEKQFVNNSWTREAKSLFTRSRSSFSWNEEEPDRLVSMPYTCIHIWDLSNQGIAQLLLQTNILEELARKRLLRRLINFFSQRVHMSKSNN